MDTLLILLVTIALLFASHLVLRRRIDRSTRPEGALDDVKREVGSIITELNQTAERTVALLEDRLDSLQTMIDQADRRITVLRRELPGTPTYTRKGMPVNAPPTPNSVPGEAPVTTANKPVTEGSAHGTTAGSAAVPLRERVRELYLQGLPVPRIATIVGKTAGEVELIISLGGDREG